MKVIYRMDAKFQDLKSSVQNIDVVIYRVNRKLFVENVVNVLLDNILKMNNVHCPSDALNAMIRLGDTGRLKFAHLQAKQRVHVEYDGGKETSKRARFQLESAQVDLEYSVYKELAKHAPLVSLHGQ